MECRRDSTGSQHGTLPSLKVENGTSTKEWYMPVYVKSRTNLESFSEIPCEYPLSINLNLTLPDSKDRSSYLQSAQKDLIKAPKQRPIRHVSRPHSDIHHSA